ncbi:MAG TPA: DNA-3-methyladenine glycosylase 2 family protein, partial [Mycobacterium sp.]|nr:DNA-3-methyladenine glycosylase 2 family protein [Mycobacterium sp.]
FTFADPQVTYEAEAPNAEAARAVDEAIATVRRRDPARAAVVLQAEGDALTALPGVGIWTAAETAQRAFGDADALSIGDYHIAKMVGWTLIGRPVDDAGMVELLEPVRPHRYRAVRLLEVSGLAVEPRRGARLPVQHIADL